MLFPSHFVLCPVCHVFLSIIETSSNMVKVSKGIKLKMTEKTDLELRTRAVCISLLPLCFSMFPLCTLNFYLNLWKKKGMYTKRCKFSATQTAMWWHQILEEFFFKSMSPMHKYTQSSCRSLNRALRDPSSPLPQHSSL